MNVRAVTWAVGLILAAASLLLLGCGDSSSPSQGKEKTYDIKGKVTKVSADKSAVTIDHEDIPGLMKAMEMKFAVESSKVLEGIEPGDQVHGRLKAKAGGDTVITELHKS